MKSHRFLEQLKRPHGLFLIFVYLLTTAGIAASVLFAIFVTENETLSVLSYCVYAIAALLLGYTVYTLVIYLPHCKRRIFERLQSHALFERIGRNYSLKTVLFAALSSIVTLTFAAMNLVSAVRYRSVWYSTLTAYYLLLLTFRIGILLSEANNRRKQDEATYLRSKWKLYLAGGIFLLVIELVTAAVITQTIVTHRPVAGGAVMAIANAAYVFYKFGMSAYHLVKAKRNADPVTQALRNLNFADACMSLFSLTVLMYTVFSEDNSAAEALTVQSAVGFAVCVVLIAMACGMILKARKALRRTPSNNDKNAP